MSLVAVEEAAAPAEVQAAARPPQALLYGLLGVMVFFWSVNYIVGKVALRSFPPLLLAGLRAALAGALILPVYAWDVRRNPNEHRWKRTDVPTLLTIGLLGVSLNQFFFVIGLSRTSVGHAAILAGLMPLMVLAIAGAMRMERITARKAAGMTVALAGVAAMTALPSTSRHDSPAGNLFIFLGSLTFALFTVAGKRATVRYGGITVNTFAYVGGALALAPLTLWQGWAFPFSRVSSAAWASVLFMAAFPAVLCYLIYYWALKYVAASRVSVLSYLQPPIATLLAVPVLGEPITLPLLAGGALVFAGVYITERSR